MAKKKAGKLPWFPFYPNDWARDLEEHPLEIEGAWIRICTKLWWEVSRGQGKKTLTQWAKILRVPNAKALSILRYIKAEKIGNISMDLTKPNSIITVVSRRMEKDEKARSDNARRQRELYKRRHPNARSTGHLPKTIPPLSVSASVSSSSSSSEVSLSETQEGGTREGTNWEIQAVFDGWQATTLDHSQMVSHETLTADIRSAIAKAISEHADPAKIIKAFENYAEVLQGQEYYWTHAWPLDLFLERGLSQFLDGAKPLENFLTKNRGEQDGKNRKDIGRSFAGAEDDAGKFEGK